jgi:hypothetical protein
MLLLYSTAACLWRWQLLLESLQGTLGCYCADCQAPTSVRLVLARRRLLLWRLCWWWRRTWGPPQAALQQSRAQAEQPTAISTHGLAAHLACATVLLSLQCCCRLNHETLLLLQR